MKLSICFVQFLSIIIIDFRKVFSLPTKSFREKTLEFDLVTREAQVTTGDFWEPFGLCILTLLNEANLGASVSLSSDGKRLVSGGNDHALLYEYERSWRPLADFANQGLAADNPTLPYSVVISHDGLRIGIGSPSNQQQGTNVGTVQVFQESATEEGIYVQMGRNLFGTSPNDDFGRSLDLSSTGLRLIVGAYGGNYITDYDWSENAQDWIANAPIVEADGSGFGFSVAISGDGSRAVIGAPFTTGINGAVNQGSIRIMELIDNSFIETKRGGFTDDEFGFQVDMSQDGLNVIVGAPGGNYARAFVFNGDTISWGNLGNDIIVDNDAGFGSAVSMSGDGTRIVIGAPLDEQFGTQSGLSRTYEYNPGTNRWDLLGGDFRGANRMDRCGAAVSFSADGRRHAVGCPGVDGTGFETGETCVATVPPTGDDDDFIFPSTVPTMFPSINPTLIPSVAPTLKLSGTPSAMPTKTHDPTNLSNPTVPSISTPSNSTSEFAVVDSFMTAPGQPLIVSAPGILENDIAGPNDVLYVDDCSIPSTGDLTFDENGGFVYIPAVNFEGLATFICTVSNGNGGLSTSAVVIVIMQNFINPSVPTAPSPSNPSDTANPSSQTVLSPSNPSEPTSSSNPTVPSPINPSNPTNPTSEFAVADTYMIQPEQPLIVSAPGILENDIAGPKDFLYVDDCTLPSTGLFSFFEDGGFIYVPPPNFAGDATFICTVSNGNGELSNSMVTISVVFTFAMDDTFTTQPGIPLIVSAPGILENDIVGPNDVLSVDDCSTPSTGTLSFDENGGFIYVPPSNFVGFVTYTCTVSNGNGGLSFSTIAINVAFAPSSPNPSSLVQPTSSQFSTISPAPFEEGEGGLPCVPISFYSQLSSLTSMFFQQVMALIISTLQGSTTVVSGVNQLFSLIFTFIFGTLFGTIGSIGFWGIWDWLMYNYFYYYCYY